MEEKIFKLRWKKSFGKDWMNIFNLKSCLFSQTYIKEGLLEVEEVGKDKKGER